MRLLKKKSVQLTAAVALSAGIILAGTFAWFNFSQNALNVFDGFTNPDVNLHDDYEEGKVNKDVYVENSGQRPLYVRVAFDEFMDLDGNSLIPGGVKANMDTWSTHAYLGTAVDNCGEAPHEYYDWIMGNAKDDADNLLDPDAGFKYYLPAPFDHRARFDQQGGQTQEPLVVTYEKNEDGTYKKMYASNQDRTVMETGAEAYARIDAILGTGTNLADLQALYAKLDDAATGAARKAVQDEIDAFLKDKNLGYWDVVTEVDESGNLGTTSVTQFVGIRPTLTTEKIYTMAEWIAAGTPTGNFWIMDTDGWCYWGNILMPGQSTGLLLSEVSLNELNKPAGRWYYGINAKLQAVTYDDIAKFAESTENQGGGGITEQGTMVLMATSGNYAFDMAADKTGPNDPVYTFINNQDGTYRLMTSDGSNTITYSPLFVYTGPVPAVTKGDIYHTGTNFGDATYQVGRSFQKAIPFGKQAETFTVVDTGRGTGVIEGKDGRHYIKLEYGPLGDKKIAWLAAGADKKFDALTQVPGGSVYTSAGDDVLVWTEDDVPGSGNDRTQESASAAYQINDTFKADGKEWVIIGKDTKAGSSTNGKTLVISANVLAANVAHDQVAAELGKVTLTDIQKADSAVTAVRLLTVQEAIDYFADNAARVANDGTVDAQNARWWLSDGIVDVNGALSAKDEAANDVGLRAAFWIDSAKLETLLKPATP